ncbi:MAG: M48 family metalloprotease [Bacteroidetes bacterium]|nr:M48 family metalloprotease [Bacteroidota bacterium]
MMIRKLFLVMLLSGALFQARAQELTGPVNFSVYQPLICHGSIPQDILLNTREKVERDMKRSSRNNPATTNYEREEFLLKSNYLLDQLMVSGKVLFGDTVTTYVNSVADRLLADEGSLRQKLRFYCLRTSAPNSFATEQGIIFVSIGMIAMLENEAQLAYILAREIAHYEKKHNSNFNLTYDRVFSRNERDRYQNVEERLLLLGMYNAEEQDQADIEGLNLLRESGYDCEAAAAALYMLQFGKLPFEDQYFKPTLLERPAMKIPALYMPDSVPAFNYMQLNNSNTYAVQPRLAERRAVIERKIQLLGNNCGNRKFGDDLAHHIYMRKVCRFETVHYQLTVRDYAGAFINAHTLLAADSNNAYLKLCIGKALYGMTKYKNAGSFGSVVTSSQKREGQQQRVYSLFNKLTAPQLNMIALRYLFDLNKEQPSEYLASLVNDLTDDLLDKHKIVFTELYELKPVTPKSENDTVGQNKPQQTTTGAEGQTFVSKYEKQKLQPAKPATGKASDKPENSNFHLFAFFDIIKDADVQKLFDDAAARVIYEQQRREKEADRFNRMSPYEQRREMQRRRQAKSTNAALGVNSVVVVDPFYFYADDRRGLKLMKSEDLRLKFCESIEETAGEANLKAELLNPKSFTARDVDKYNDLAAINDWLGERMSHDNALNIIPVESDAARSASTKYKAEHIYITGVLTYKQVRENRGAVLLYSLIFYPMLPFGIAYALTPEHDTYYYSMVYNINTGEERMKRVVHLHSNARNGFIVSQMYDTMLQIKTKPARKARQ